MVGQRVAGAVVPCWRGWPITDGQPWFTEMIARQFDELLLHGYTHYNDRGLGGVGLLTGRCDEFNGLDPQSAERRIASAQTVLAEVFSRPVLGFVPPAWRPGPVTLEMLARQGLFYCVGMHQVVFTTGSHIPLVTWSWDCGVIAGLGYLGELYGSLSNTVRRRALRAVVIHPLDVDRGFLQRALERIALLVNQGCQPVLMADFLDGFPAARSV